MCGFKFLILLTKTHKNHKPIIPIISYTLVGLFLQMGIYWSDICFRLLVCPKLHVVCNNIITKLLIVASLIRNWFGCVIRTITAPNRNPTFQIFDSSFLVIPQLISVIHRNTLIIFGPNEYLKSEVFNSKGTKIIAEHPF